MKPIKRVSAKKYRGLGDVIEVIAQPIAKGIDYIFDTNLQNCESCKDRREKWNKW